MLYYFITHPQTRESLQINSVQGKRVLRMFILQWLQSQKGGGSTQHFTLGNPNLAPLHDMVTKCRKIIKHLSVNTHFDKSLQSNVIGFTVPHAGMEYCGELACLLISELVLSHPLELPITIVWFRHNSLDSNPEHSCKNVMRLAQALFPNKTFLTHEATAQPTMLESPFLISTDFSHYPPPHVSLRDTWLKDRQNISETVTHPRYHMPCGVYGLHAMHSYLSENSHTNRLRLQMQAYSSSESPHNWWSSTKDTLNSHFKGVTYAGIGLYATPPLHPCTFFDCLQSHTLAYAHIQALHQYLNTLPHEVPPDIATGLFWSPLHSYVEGGSCFVTVSTPKSESDFTLQTYACFGDWEPSSTHTKLPTLMSRLVSACHSLRTNRWGGNESVSALTFETLPPNSPYSISITLIEPKSFWKPAPPQIDDCEPNRGYVWYNPRSRNNGVTFIPSVWQSMLTPSGRYDKTQFFTSLQKKQGRINAGLELYQYNSIEWKFTFAR